MPTTSTQSRKSTSTRTAAARTPDAIKLLTQDHKEVKALFKEYEKLCKADADETQKQALAEQICEMLTVHAQIEEELVYPAAYEALDESDLVDEAQVEHASAKDLIAQIRGMQPADELYDAKVTVLGEYIDHHVKEEEKEMFPKLRKSELDLKELGVSLQARKSELMGEEPPVH
ncbi:hemerythrin domain-containing protein [Rhizobacter sp. J219]|jgi:hemerythrin superfamily protein|uniref:hemerythrin domain-containing protein n=1 Tax=Rhizobacter sp. J219 TaxID=2898430 RepID=UPI0021517F59|nr:hemerythrin domain-containing protein [Rhizobacter sp. J219]MCR5885875.1 hemerythrin domain-containing protein [Rhizobacter sp. J219]